MPDDVPRVRRADLRLMTVAGLVLLGVAVTAFVRAVTPEWGDAQAAVRAEVARRLGPERAATLPRGLQQIWLPELGRVDRCITCHEAYDWGSSLADAPNPARSHPLPKLMAAHPPARFGCTLCHGGQGAAVTQAAAHGEVEFWDEPLLGTRLAKRYGLSEAELLEMRCNACHRDQEEVAEMPLLNRAKALVKAKRCVRCHTIFGVGAHKAPDLSREGEKHPSHYAFPPTWTGRRTALRWHVAHFEAPSKVVPDTLMPNFLLEERDATGLALLVLSWKRQHLPASYLPRR